MKRTATRVLLGAMAASSAIACAEAPAAAAPPWVERPIVLPRHVFAGDVGLGIGHVGVTPAISYFGPGINLEAAFGITDTVQLSLRTGLRLGDDGQRSGADAYGRTLFTETYGVAGDVVANPELGVRWAVYQGRVVEVALDGRMYLPIEDNSNFGIMMGVPLAFHIGDSVRIDTGAYVPVVFNNRTTAILSIPGYFWFQTSERVWLGPMAAVRFLSNAPANETDLLLGFGLGYQISNAIDLKTQLFFPRIDQDQGGRFWGAGVGLQFRVE